MELFNYGKGQVSVERQTYEAIRNSVDFSYDEFMKMDDNERMEWVDACRLALLLIEEKPDVLYEGYRLTNMFDDKGNFNLGNATSIIYSKKKALSMIEKYTDIEFTTAQFILLGENGTCEVINNGLKSINQKTARDLNSVIDKDEAIEILECSTDNSYRKYSEFFDEKNN